MKMYLPDFCSYGQLCCKEKDTTTLSIVALERGSLYVVLTTGLPLVSQEKFPDFPLHF